MYPRPPVIKLHKFGPAFGLPDASPFVVKVETYLRMSGQKYEVVTSDVRKAPRGQLPFVDIDGTVIPDSTAIIEFLEAKRDPKMDARLSADERANGLAFKSMLEEYLYFGVLQMRWAEDDGWEVFQPNLRKMLTAGGVPSFLVGLLTSRIRKQVAGRARTQGMGRKPRAEIVKVCCEMIDALAVRIGDRPYLFGDAPTTYDATAYAFAAGALCPAFANEIQRSAAANKTLVTYADRIREKYWQE